MGEIHHECYIALSTVHRHRALLHYALSPPLTLVLLTDPAERERERERELGPGRERSRARREWDGDTVAARGTNRDWDLGVRREQLGFYLVLHIS
jgi:hypothetical protein